MGKRRKEPRRYAEGTPVAVSKTKQEIEKLLVAHGAKQRAMVTDELAGKHIVRFSIGDGVQMRQVRFELPCHDDPAEDRRVWRVLGMVLKMKLELIRGGDSTVDSEFLPNVVLPNGDTVMAAIAQEVSNAYALGEQPRFLLGDGTNG